MADIPFRVPLFQIQKQMEGRRQDVRLLNLHEQSSLFHKQNPFGFRQGWQPQAQANSVQNISFYT